MGRKNHINMNQRVSKLLRKWCIAGKYNYKMSKKMYKKANCFEREKIIDEINLFLEKHIPQKS